MGRSYFSCVAEGLESGGHAARPRLPEGTPTGLIFLMAGRPQEAIASLQALIAGDRAHARSYAYLGDAFHLMGDRRSARVCYLKAFALSPRDVDVERLLEDWERKRDPALVPTLFAHGLILSENAGALGLTFDFDLVDVRRRMKAWHPDLFALYMERLSRKTSKHGKEF